MMGKSGEGRQVVVAALEALQVGLGLRGSCCRGFRGLLCSMMANCGGRQVVTLLHRHLIMAPWSLHSNLLLFHSGTFHNDTNRSIVAGRRSCF
jgi:hypothetical protein